MEFPFESFSIIFEISDACHLNEFYHEVVLHINTCIFCLFVCFFVFSKVPPLSQHSVVSAGYGFTVSTEGRKWPRDYWTV